MGMMREFGYLVGWLGFVVMGKFVGCVCCLNIIVLDGLWFSIDLFYFIVE